MGRGGGGVGGGCGGVARWREPAAGSAGLPCSPRGWPCPGEPRTRSHGGTGSLLMMPRPPPPCRR